MAEELNQTNATADAAGAENKETQTEEKLSMTQAELDALLQRVSDQRVSQALKTVEKKQKEAEKLRSMSDAEKYEYQLKQREEAIAAKELELTLAENKAAAASVLIEKGLSAKLVDFVVASDADEMNEKIKTLEKEFKACVKAEVEKRMGSSTPRKNLAAEESITRETLNKMSLAEVQRFATENPTLYKSLYS